MIIQTGDYSAETFTMEVEVVDDDGAPVAGASVRAFAPWVIDNQTYWDTAGELSTDAAGIASFELEPGHRFGLRVQTPLGSWPAAENTLDQVLPDTVPAGAVERVEVDLEALLPEGLNVTVAGLEGAQPVNVAFADQEGRALTSSQRYGHLFSTPVAAPDLELALVDQAGYEAYRDGDAFYATWAGGNSDAVVDLPADGWWYLLVSNPQLSVAAVGDLSVSVGAAELAMPYELLPGGSLVLVLDPL
jgi:hypothetical protein